MWRNIDVGSGFLLWLSGYVLGILSGCSQLINAVLGGSPLETFSARAYRNQDSAFWDIVRRLLDTIFSPRAGGHCKQSFIDNAQAAKDLVK